VSNLQASGAKSIKDGRKLTDLIEAASYERLAGIFKEFEDMQDVSHKVD
jgi:hypothetical protein